MTKKILLEEQKIETGFTVPDGFFENNKAEIMSRVLFEKEKTKSRLPWLSIAASLAIVVSAIILWQTNQSSQTSKTNQEITDYLTLKSSVYFDLIEDNYLTDFEIKNTDEIYDLSENEIEEILTANPKLLLN
jgi:hypothetical protein